MRYVFLAFNYTTLCKAIKYIDMKIGRDHATIVYTDSVAPLPEKIAQDYCVEQVHMEAGKNGARFGNLRYEAKNGLITYRAIEKAIGRGDKTAIVVLFKDNETRESMVIDRCRRKFGDRVHFWLIEEGLGIYTTDKSKRQHIHIQKVLYKFLGLSTYPLTGNPQGLNPEIEKIICARPALLKNKYNGRTIEIEQQITVFDKPLSDYFITSIMGQPLKIAPTRFVLLTSPIQDMDRYGSDLTKKYHQMLETVLPALSKRGTVLIKIHPRDEADYSKYLTETVCLLEKKYNALPFECVYGALGGPRLLSLFSSAGVSLNQNNSSIFLYKLIGIDEVDKNMDDAFMEAFHIDVCRSVDHLKALLKAASICSKDD